MITPQNQDEKHVTLHWNEFMEKLNDIPVPQKRDTALVKKSSELIERISSQDLPLDYLKTLEDSAINMAWSLIDEQSDNAIVELGHFLVDEDAWSELISQIGRLDSQCDPSIGEVFI